MSAWSRDEKEEINVKSVFKNTAFAWKRGDGRLKGARVAVFGIGGVGRICLRGTSQKRRGERLTLSMMTRCVLQT